MDKYYCLGIVRFVDRKRTIVWGKPHASVSECLDVNKSFIEQNLGKEFIVQSFTKPVTASPQ